MKLNNKNYIRILLVLLWSVFLGAQSSADIVPFDRLKLADNLVELSSRIKKAIDEDKFDEIRKASLTDLESLVDIEKGDPLTCFLLYAAKDVSALELLWWSSNDGYIRYLAASLCCIATSTDSFEGRIIYFLNASQRFNDSEKTERLKEVSCIATTYKLISKEIVENNLATGQQLDYAKYYFKEHGIPIERLKDLQKR